MKYRQWFIIFSLVSAMWFPPYNMAFAQTPISCGEIVSGSISVVGEQDSYTFTADAGDVARVILTKTAGNNMQVELYDPALVKIASGNTYNGAGSVKLDNTLTQSGTYTVIVSGYQNNQTGDYIVSWNRINRPCPPATGISCGQIASGSISAVTEQDFYTFTADAGDVARIIVTTTSGGMEPTIELYNSTWTKIASATGWGNNRTIDTTLAEGGTYTIIVSDYGNSETGDYSIGWYRFNNPCNTTGTTCGQIVSGALSAVTEQDFYTFTADAGDVARIVVTTTSGGMEPTIEMYNSTWTKIASATGWGNNRTIDTTLAEGGTYTIIVSDYGNSETGDYNIGWYRFNNPCNAAGATCGQPASGSISAIGEQDFYTFTATAGDMVTIRSTVTSGSMDPSVELYDPAFTLIANASPSPGLAIINKTLSTNGTYTVIVNDEDENGTGNYTLTWHNLNNPCNATPIACGQTVSGSLNPVGEQDLYTFQASAGYNAVLTMTRAAGGVVDPYLELYDQITGTRISYTYTSSGTSTEINQVLASDGTYIGITSDYGSNETGDYTLTFQKVNNSCSQVAVTSPNGGEIVESGVAITITWTGGASPAISTQDITLSTDGGLTFPITIATGLSGNVRSFNWTIPQDVATTKGRVRVTVNNTDGTSNPDDSNADFLILQSVAESSITYVYDNLSRLVQIIYGGGTTITYTYDAAGNRTTVVSTP